MEEWIFIQEVIDFFLFCYDHPLSEIVMEGS